MSSSSVPRATRTSADGTPPSIWALDDLAALRQQDAASGGAGPADPTPQDAAVAAAYERGYEEGRLAGESAEAARLRGAFEALADGLTSVQEDGATWTSNLEENVAAVAVAVAHQILGREATTEPATVAQLVTRALAEFPIEQSLVVRLNPADLQAMISVVSGDPQASSAFGGRSDVQWVPDARLAPGGCMIEGRDRVIDGRVDSALERMYRRLSYTGA
jgi:flagellar biosynthesis/type III secretory pathway protein FliH